MRRFNSVASNKMHALTSESPNLHLLDGRGPLLADLPRVLVEVGHTQGPLRLLLGGRLRRRRRCGRRQEKEAAHRHRNLQGGRPYCDWHKRSEEYMSCNGRLCNTELCNNNPAKFREPPSKCSLAQPKNALFCNISASHSRNLAGMC